MDFAIQRLILRFFVVVFISKCSGKRDFQDNKADVILKYNVEEARRLKAMGELPDSTQINAADKIGEGDEDIPFDFEEI